MDSRVFGGGIMKGFIEVTEMCDLYPMDAEEYERITLVVSNELKGKEDFRKALHDAGLNFHKEFKYAQSWHNDKEAKWYYKFNLFGYKKRIININKIIDIKPYCREYINEDYKLVIGCDIRFNDEHIYCQETYEEIKQKIKQAQEQK